ncbi:hypothetical protein JTB14_002236 [Gonioctena quinquepunctata]|nr:hypothetical protein JTB14_002236 [Gonioctena quinquepunctata]
MQCNFSQVSRRWRRVHSVAYDPVPALLPALQIPRPRGASRRVDSIPLLSCPSPVSVSSVMPPIDQSVVAQSNARSGQKTSARAAATTTEGGCPRGSGILLLDG